MEGLELDQHGELVPLYFAVTRWMRSESWLHQDAFAHVILSAGTDIEVRRICLDPAAYLSDRFAEHAGVVRFSGTVSPLPLYQRLHGQICAPQERAESPFSADQALVMVVPDIPTYFKQRHSSLTLLVNTIRRPGLGQAGSLFGCSAVVCLSSRARCCGGCYSVGGGI